VRSERTSIALSREGDRDINTKFFPIVTHSTRSMHEACYFGQNNEKGLQLGAEEPPNERIFSGDCYNGIHPPIYIYWIVQTGCFGRRWAGVNQVDDVILLFSSASKVGWDMTFSMKSKTLRWEFSLGSFTLPLALPSLAL